MVLNVSNNSELLSNAALYVTNNVFMGGAAAARIASVFVGAKILSAKTKNTQNDESLT